MLFGTAQFAHLIESWLVGVGWFSRALSLKVELPTEIAHCTSERLGVSSFQFSDHFCNRSGHPKIWILDLKMGNGCPLRARMWQFLGAMRNWAVDFTALEASTGEAPEEHPGRSEKCIDWKNGDGRCLLSVQRYHLLWAEDEPPVMCAFYASSATCSMRRWWFSQLISDENLSQEGKRCHFGLFLTGAAPWFLDGFKLSKFGCFAQSSTSSEEVMSRP